MSSAVVALRLLLLAACRLSEIRFLCRDSVKDGCIELPNAKTRGRVVPFGSEARAVPANLPREHVDPWVIVSRMPISPMSLYRANRTAWPHR